MRVSSRSSRSHSSSVCVLPSCVTVAAASSLVAFSTASMAEFGIAMHDAERVAGLVEIAEARERELHVAHFAQRAAADDALVGEHFGGGGIRARELGDRGGRRGRLSGTGGNAAAGAAFP